MGQGAPGLQSYRFRAKCCVSPGAGRRTDAGCVFNGEDRMAETLQVEARKSRGKRNAKRLRAGGKVPAVLYGHGEKTVSLSVPAEQLSSAVRHGSRVVDLKGAVSDSAL